MCLLTEWPLHWSKSPSFILVLVQKTHPDWFSTPTPAVLEYSSFSRSLSPHMSLVLLHTTLSSCLLKCGLKCVKLSLLSLLSLSGNVFPGLCSWLPLILGFHLKCPLPSSSLLIIPGNYHLITVYFVLHTNPQCQSTLFTRLQDSQGKGGKYLSFSVPNPEHPTSSFPQHECRTELPRLLMPRAQLLPGCGMPAC